MEFKWMQKPQDDLREPFAVRTEVFVQEQGYAQELELDALDDRALHIIAYLDGEAVATARLFKEEGDIWHLGRVAVRKPWRGRGIGAALVAQAEKKAREQGAEKIVLGAQVSKRIFYEKQGYLICGQGYLDEGVPHIEMEKKL
ncbi:MAG: GNAT family N-acetyltransferase [Oscillospiraceae bacterium]|nr:GNAT family N-acetyltransferase [Oscillospiraceae bacterium]